MQAIKNKTSMHFPSKLPRDVLLQNEVMNQEAGRYTLQEIDIQLKERVGTRKRQSPRW